MLKIDIKLDPELLERLKQIQVDPAKFAAAMQRNEDLPKRAKGKLAPSWIAEESALFNALDKELRERLTLVFEEK